MSEQTPFFRDLDRVIHERGRLAIVAMLAAAPAPGEVSFSELKHLLGLTDGNLITHLRTLEGAGYLRLLRDSSGNRPRTRARLTAAGKRAFERYLEVLEGILGPSASEAVRRRADETRRARGSRGIASSGGVQEGLAPG